MVGEGLFDFGFVDGERATARLQHPLGVTVLPDGTLGIADTYNGAVRRFDPTTGLLSPIASGLSEPSGLVLAGETAYVVESAAHVLAPLDLCSSAARSEERRVGKECVCPCGSRGS